MMFIMRWLFLIAVTVDCIAVLVAFYFLIADFIKQSSSSNGPLATATLAFCGWIGLCFYLNAYGRPGLAATLAGLPALPLLAYGLIILIMVIGKPDFK